MATLISNVHTAKYELEVYECECGFHIGLDASYIEQVGDINTACPACQRNISTMDPGPNE